MKFNFVISEIIQFKSSRIEIERYFFVCEEVEFKTARVHLGGWNSA